MTLVLKLLESDDCIQLQKPSSKYADKLNELLEWCRKSNNGYVCVSLDKPRKPRTTGELSQNNLVWKLITIIANEVGDTSPGMKDTEDGLKERALSRGYPYHFSKITGKKIPESMTKIDTIQCSYLIDTAYQIIAELGIVLPPNFGGNV